ncbi:MAG TPA: hypothetical protein VHC69_11905 [Polyangiaceae bacterium]|nr:hypothetical protein [Polyangiaceae bacterium]
MKSTIAIVAFATMGAGAVGASALNLNLKGSDTLKATTLALLHDPAIVCGGVGNTPAESLDYDGTGSANGQALLVDTSSGQFVAPMSRALNNGSGLCANANRTRAEGLVFALDGVSLVAKGSTVNAPGATACNGTNSPACLPQTAGLSFSGTIPIPPAPCSVDLDCSDPTARPGVFGESCINGQCAYNVSSWKQVLRILFFGFSEPPPPSGFTPLARRNCASPERQALAANYYQMFQGGCAGHGGTCTGIQHLFRLNDESGTTDLFVSAVNAGAVDLANNSVPFCNAGTRGPNWGSESHANGDTCTPASGNSPQTGCDDGAACVTANDGIHHCEGRQTCTTDADCGAAPGGFITTGGCTANDSDCRGVPLKSCNVNPVTGGPNVCIASRLFLACNVDTDCGVGLADACVSDPGSVTGKSCIKGKTGQLSVSSFGAFMPQAPNNRPRNPLYNITADPEVSFSPYRGEYFTDMQDRDPIRILCDPNEDVCSVRGDLGLLLPIWNIPDDVGQPAEIFPTNGCTSGRFSCAAISQPRLDFGALSNAVYELCADGGDPNKGAGGCPKGFCPLPITSVALGNTPVCNAPPHSNTTIKVQAYQGQVYNLTSWRANGSSFTKITVPRATGFASPHAVPAVASVNMVGAFYKLHNVHVMANANGAPTCHESSATEQIGCLVQASPCSLGLAGRSAASVGTDALALKVNQIDPNNLCIQNYLKSCPTCASTYLLSRPLYLNTLNGFENLASESSDQLLMANCFANGHAGDKATGLGLVPLPTSLGSVNIGTSYCEDFNEATVCGDATNVDACKAAGQGNPAPIPGCEINVNTNPPTADDPATANCQYGTHY